MLAQQFSDTASYAVAKTDFCQKIDKLAFHDFSINIPFIETERCKAYIPQLPCLDDYTNMLADKELIACYGVAFNSEQAEERLLADINHWDKYGFGPWMWYDKYTNQYIGRVGLRQFELESKQVVELAYVIQPAYWGKGLTVEMSRVAINFGFATLGLNELICFTLTTNKQSLRVMEKLGLHYEKNFLYKELPHKLYNLTSSKHSKKA